MMRRTWALFFFSIGLVAAGCGGVFKSQEGGLALDGTTKDKLERRYVGRDLVLASSVYVSDFFGDDKLLFADARPFEIITMWRHDGAQAEVGAARAEIIPAGTPVRVTRVDYPVDPLTAVIDERSGMKLAPTAHTWLVVERTEQAGAAPLVLVLPKDIADENAFEAEVQKRLASPQWMAAWLGQSDPMHLARVFEKKVEPGMSSAALFAALGEPKNAAEQRDAGTLEFVADYGDLQITVQGNLVQKVVSLKAEAAVAQKRAAEEAEKARLLAEEKRKQDEIARAEQEAKDKVRAEEEAKQKAEADKKAAAEQKVRDEALAKQKAEDEKKRAAEEKKQKEAAELQVRLEAAKRAKEEAQAERQRKEEQKKLAADVARAEAEAKAEQKRAAQESARADAEREAERRRTEAEARKAEAEAKRAEAEARKAEAEAAAARKKAEEQEQKAARDRQVAEEKKAAEQKAAQQKSSGQSSQAGAGAPAERKPLAASSSTSSNPPPAAAPAPASKTSTQPAGAPAPASAGKTTTQPAAGAPASPRRIGVKLQAVNADVATEKKLAQAAGALIVTANADGAAEKSGVKGGDVVLAVDGKPVSTPDDFTRLVGATSPADPVTLTLWRDGAEVKLIVTQDGKAPAGIVAPPKRKKPLMPSARSAEEAPAESSDQAFKPKKVD